MNIDHHLAGQLKILRLGDSLKPWSSGSRRPGKKTMITSASFSLWYRMR